MSSYTGRAVEPNSVSTLSYYRPLHEFVNRAITLLFPAGVRKHSLRTDRLWGPTRLLFNAPTGSASSEIKYLRREVDCSPPPSQINVAISLLPGFLYCVYRNALIFWEYCFNKMLQRLRIECAKVPSSCKDSQKSTSINYLASFCRNIAPLSNVQGIQLTVSILNTYSMHKYGSGVFVDNTKRKIEGFSFDTISCQFNLHMT